MDSEHSDHNAGHHPDAHDPDHGHNHDHEHEHEHDSGPLRWLLQVFHLGGHSHAENQMAADDALAGSEEGIRTIWISLALLAITTVIQALIYFFYGSVALLADTVHNLGDGLNTLPLLLAFRLSGRAATRRYNYGYHRAEDIAGVIIVLSIGLSAGYIFYESINKFFSGSEISNLGAVAAAAIIGFVGNEAVANIQIRTGRRIGSAALVADGQHARTDGLTSLAVLLAAAGVWLGYPLVDPIVGIIIGFAIVAITWDTIKAVYYRLMDAIEPAYYEQVERIIDDQIGQDARSQSLHQLRLRWLGHRIYGDASIGVSADVTVADGHEVAEKIRDAVFNKMPLLADLVVHVEPAGIDLHATHRRTKHREPVPQPLQKP